MGQLQATTRVQLRYADMDGLGHVNNTVYHELLQEARALLLDHVRTEEERYVVVHAEIDHRREVRLADGWVEAWAQVAEVGRRSVTIDQGLRLPDGTEAATGRVVLVAWSRSGRCSRPISDRERAMFLG
jgi:acyl-CoA thioester hydrolase